MLATHVDVGILATVVAMPSTSQAPVPGHLPAEAALAVALPDGSVFQESSVVEGLLTSERQKTTNCAVFFSSGLAS